MKKKIFAIIAVAVLIVCCLTLFASCNDSVVVSFQTNGGTTIKDRILNGNFTMPEDPEKEGFVFAGWYLDSSFDNQFIFTKPSDIGGAVTLHARWAEPTYDVSFNANGGTLGQSSQTVDFNQSYTLPIPVKEGYIFIGWFDQDNTRFADATGVGVGAWSNIGDITLFAHYSEQSVLFDYRGATGQNTAKGLIIAQGENYTLPVPTRDSFTFMGWFSQANGGGTRYTGKDGASLVSWNEAGVITLYAHWLHNPTATAVSEEVVFGEGLLQWRPVEEAASYVVSFDGQNYPVTSNMMVLPLFKQNTTADITIVALDADGQQCDTPTAITLYRPNDSQLTVQDIVVSDTSFGTRVDFGGTVPEGARSFSRIYNVVTGKTLTFSSFVSIEIISQSGNGVATVNGNSVVTLSVGAVELICTKADNTTEIRFINVTPNTSGFQKGVDYSIRENTISNLNDSTKVVFMDKNVKDYTVGTGGVFIPDIVVSNADFAFVYSLAKYNTSTKTFEQVALSDYAEEVGNALLFKEEAEGEKFEVSVSGRYIRSTFLPAVKFTITVNDGVNVYTQEQFGLYFGDLTVSKINLLRNIQVKIPKTADYFFYSWKFDTDGVYEYGTDDPTREDYNPELYYSQPGAVLGRILTDYAMGDESTHPLGFGGAEVVWDENGFAGPITQTDFSSLYNLSDYEAKTWLYGGRVGWSDSLYKEVEPMYFYDIDPVKTPAAYGKYGDTKTKVYMQELKALFYEITLGDNSPSGSDLSSVGDDGANWRAGALRINYTWEGGEAVLASGVLFDILGNDITDIVAQMNGNHLLEQSDFIAYEQGYTAQDLEAFARGEVGERAVIARTAQACFNELFVRNNFMVTPNNPLYSTKLEVFGNYFLLDANDVEKFHVYCSFTDETKASYKYLFNSDMMALVDSLRKPMHLTFEGVIGIYGKRDNDIVFDADFNGYTMSREGLQVVINDISFVGNDSRPDGYDEEGNEIDDLYYNDHGYQTIRLDKAFLTVNNCLLKQALTNIHVQASHLNVNKTLLYNTFDWNVYITLRSIVRCEDSYIGYSGGAAMGMQGWIRYADNDTLKLVESKYYGQKIELHDTFLSNWVSGTETWFEIYNLSTSATLVKGLLDDTVMKFTDNQRKIVIEDDHDDNPETLEIEFFNFAILGFTTNSVRDHDIYNITVETTDDNGVVHYCEAIRPGHDAAVGGYDSRVADGMFMAPVSEMSRKAVFDRYAGLDIQATITAALTDYATNGRLTGTYSVNQMLIVNTFMAEASVGKYTLNAAGATKFVQDYAIQRHTLGAMDVEGILNAYLSGSGADQIVVPAYQKACGGNAAAIASEQYKQVFIDDSKHGCVLGEVAVALGTYQAAPTMLTARQAEIVAKYSALSGNLVSTVTHYAMKGSFENSALYYDLGDIDGTSLIEVRGTQQGFRFTLMVWHYDMDAQPEVELTPNAA